MLYLLLFLEIAATALLLFLRFNRFKVVKQRINPNNHDENSHNMVKTGKTKRIQVARSKYQNSMVLITAVGLAAISFTFLFSAGQAVDQHRKDGLINERLEWSFPYCDATKKQV